ncbi:hypothetical protein MSG_04940 [Mycobacterium shigaense]|uniref:Uncharacterized protein n=1 Tax=Mycobacterium shigaense TaxID=722731 RepID=A0A1Z4EQ60_9MYCO|nr:hypothetical protein MSG_04940 [Mycobacterium shigaense]
MRLGFRPQKKWLMFTQNLILIHKYFEKDGGKCNVTRAVYAIETLA